MILVTTAGKVGSEAGRLRAEREVPVRVLVLVRDPDRAKSQADFGAEIAVGDLGVPAGIDEAMAGVTAVVLVSPAVPAQELNIVASAARAGVGHVVKAMNKASADSPIARRRGQAEIEADIRHDLFQPWNCERSPASHASRRPGLARSQSGWISRLTSRRSCHSSLTDGRPQNQ